MLGAEEMIIQIIPADPRWHACYKDEKEFIRCRIACWALVEDEGGYRAVQGLEADGEAYLDTCENTSNFHHYEFIDESPMAKSKQKSPV